MNAHFPFRWSASLSSHFSAPVFESSGKAPSKHLTPTITSNAIIMDQGFQPLFRFNSQTTIQPDQMIIASTRAVSTILAAPE